MLLQNCFLVDFTDYRFDNEIKSEIDCIVSTQVKVEVMRLLVAFKKRGRILQVIDDDYSGSSDLEMIAKHVMDVPLELVVLRTGTSWDEAATRVPSVTIIGFAASTFESARSEEMASRPLSDGAMRGVEFIERYLDSLIRVSRHVHIIDYSLGLHYQDDYRYTLDKLFEHLRKVAPHLKVVTVHTEVGKKKMADNVEQDVVELASKHGLNGKVEVRFYANGESRALPHQRFLASELGVIDVGRGFDFIEKASGMLRNTTVAVCASEVSSIIGESAGYVTSNRT